MEHKQQYTDILPPLSESTRTQLSPLPSSIVPATLQPRRTVLNVNDEVIQRSLNESLVQYKPPVKVNAANATQVATLNKPSNSLPKPVVIDPRKPQVLTDILNAVLPPRTYQIENPQDVTQSETVIQSVSSTPSSREDVIRLTRLLDNRLQYRQARQSGICPVREELYSQCFDELLRQITIDSPERGLLLLRLRDEIRMSVSAYQTLYSSSLTFGLRKAMASEVGLAEMKQKLDTLELEKETISQQVNAAKLMFETLEKKQIEQKIIEEKKMNEEKEFLKFQATHLEAFLKSAAQ